MQLKQCLTTAFRETAVPLMETDLNDGYLKLLAELRTRRCYYLMD